MRYFNFGILLRVTVHFSLFIAVSAILNFWLTTTDPLRTQSFAYSAIVFIVLCVTLISSLLIGLVPAQLESSRWFYLMFSTVYEGLVGHRKAFFYIGAFLLRRMFFVLTVFAMRSKLGSPLWV